jgi:hypothetical protein
MTIQLLQTWNGFPAGVYSTFSGPEETRLIGLGLARDYVDAIDGASGRGGSVVPISAATLASPTAAMLADTRTFYELQTTKALYRSSGASLELVGAGPGGVGAVAGVPSGGVDGALVIRTDSPMAGVPYRNTLGSWAALNNSFTWAARPAAASYPGAVILITDWGQEFYSDGTNWIPVGKRLQLICSAAVGTTITGARAASFTDTNLIPAGLVLPNCWFWAYSTWVHVGGTNAKNTGTAIGGAVINEPPAAGGSTHLSSNVSATGFVKAVSGAGNVQLSSATTGANSLQSSNSAAPATATVDFTIANTVTWNGTTTGDNTTCNGRRFEIYFP